MKPLEKKYQMLIIGGGIGGMAAAIGASLAGWGVQVFERSEAFSELGAGVQLGPNAVRLLRGWGLERALEMVAVAPEFIEARNASSGQVLARMPLAERVIDRYGAPYLTIHRADLLRLLMEHAMTHTSVTLHALHEVVDVRTSADNVVIRTAQSGAVEGLGLILADGIWSKLRNLVVPDEQDPSPRETGHLAWRAVMPMHDVPHQWRSPSVVAWMGESLHVVHYPIRGGQLLNIIVATHGKAPDNIRTWDHAANTNLIESHLKDTCTPLQDVVRLVGATGAQWRLWPLFDRKPLSSAAQMARGRVALLGDTAHPMRPYLAQGAGMAIEDAAVLQRVLTEDAAQGLCVIDSFARYAQLRWQRAARVQARSIRNGQIFHATGIMRWGRDMALRMFGEQLMDVPWLYDPRFAPMPVQSPPPPRSRAPSSDSGLSPRHNDNSNNGANTPPSHSRRP